MNTSVGSVLTTKYLKGAFDPWSIHVLSGRGYVKRLDRKKGSQQTYSVVRELPTADEYKKLRDEQFTITADDLVGEANSIVEELAEEMRSWFENLSEGLQQADRGQRVGDSADALESLQLPEVPSDIEEVKILHLPLLSISSRADRASDAAGRYQAAADAARSYVEDYGSDVGFDVSIWESFADECEDVASELEDVDFPGMYD
jgi:hypothetical protein